MEKDMRAVVEANIQRKLAKGMTNVKSATTRMLEEGKMSRDFIFDVGTERRGQEPNIIFKPDSPEMIGGNFKIKNEKGIITPEDFTINMHAIKQVATKLNIPGAYLTSLLLGDAWQQTLGYEILNTHNGWSDRSKLLVRAIGSEVRAFLSDSYRRLDSAMIFAAHIEEIFANKGALSDGFMDDTKIMIESIYPKSIEIITELNGTIWIAFGTRLTSSDYGNGAQDLRSFILQGACLNGMVRESVLREIHLGAKLPDNLALSQATYELDSATTASAIRDLTKNLYSSEVIKDRMLEIKASSDLVIDHGQVLKSLKDLNKLMKGEVDNIGQILMRNDPMQGVQGESTLWKLTQGITAYANQEDVSDLRRMELQEVAGELFKKIKN